MEEPKSTAKRRTKTSVSVQEDKITLLPLSELRDFPNHPFKVRDDEAMQETAESIRQYGVLVPAIVRPREDGGYEIVAGHRRKHGSELAGLQNLPCIVREMDDDTATILMVDSNIQRENILPSERAQAYKMKLEATPDTAEPYTEKPAQLNKDRRNKEKEIPDESITDTSNPDPIYPPAPLQGAGYDGMGYEEAREIVKDNIEYDILVQDPRQDKEQLDEVVELIAETLCSRKKTIVIAGDEYPADMVKEKLLRITSSHIEYVFDCLKQNTTYVRNIKKYLLASLFNAPSTIGSYYSALVNHDMYGDGLRGR